MPRPRSRRTILAAAVGLAAAGAVIPARAQTPPATPAAASPVAGIQPDGTWVFVDDVGAVITLPETPTRVIAQTTSAAALWDFGFPVSGIFGPSVQSDGTPDPQTGNLDLAAVTVLGDGETGEIDLEAVTSLGAELYVDLDRGTGTPWYLSGESAAALTAQAPVLLINAAAVSYIETIHRFEGLAAALGADVETPALAAARDDLALAEADLQAALAANPGLRVLAIAGDPSTNLYLINPDVAGDLLYMRDLGVDVFTPDNPDPSGGGNFALVSWEQFGTYPADIILYDRRAFADRDELLAYSDPVWDALPAVQASQIGFWEGTIPYTYPALAQAVRDLTALIEQSTRVAPE